MAVYYTSYNDPQLQFDRFFENAFGLTRSTQATEPIFKPKMDIHEDTDKNIVTATFELPGLKKDDIQIDVHDHRLTVTGESKLSSEHDEAGYSTRERRFGKFSRSLRLPQGITDDQVKASMENGILKVIFPKAGPEKEPKKIMIS